MQKGKIVRIMDKGYGFITYEGATKDLFFHSKELQNAAFDDLKGGESVEFEIGEGQKGPQALKVKVI